MEIKQIELLAEQALDAACKSIQESLSIRTGDLAGRYFSGDEVKAVFIDYITQEVSEGATLKSDGEIVKFGSQEERQTAMQIIEAMVDGEIITVFYSGAGDDGGIQEVDSSISGNGGGELFDRIRDFSEGLISDLYGAYYDGEPGGGGTAEFDRDKRAITVRHYYNETNEVNEAPQIFTI
ncbi:hypothetical protein ICN48_06455 [Polynucleobacter sp. JS-Safj-400b-B2]|uniref:hypothetical protein n=1 Tax=Polynucleobacter sp. JS-Safj-400b-B2 TaxID=2576921 RepID=UPI001C0BD284|nr:hypothetical protein [Polynucleobacter sp. JS-Safj-400b-B2]MBU3625874.1 hypothetical protein [Polynucleobacter sp. JS-Safj-400b-B2]